ncbi:multiple RNA-binding domain-containing protein 1 [Quercus robur]|uniref:multiple RNA-binding domain-containing protein 1 n=1 Tax=Quercus robur TaxID=38942 RepID=UPI002162EF3C|nr:multiple RNA-binding domain-containing protein 1 [Quercus robur]
MEDHFKTQTVPHPLGTRICVKNLPKYVAEDRLRELFSQKGEITDAKLMRTKNGKSRQFAFIGFRTEPEAGEAIRYFNKSYIDTFRITCEIAHKVGDPSLPRPWSQYSLKKEEKATEEKKLAGAKNSSLVGSKEERKNLKKGSENYDPKLQEFLEVMQPRMKSKLWANDTLITNTADQNVNLSEKQIQEKEEHNDKSFPVHVDLDEHETVEHGLSDSHETKKPHNLAHDELISDMDYFKSRVKQEWSDSENSDDDDNDNDSDKNDDNNYKEDRSGSLKESIESQDARKVDPKGSNTTLKEVVPEEEVEEEEHSHDLDSGISKPGHLASSLKDEKEVVLETGRLFVRNLPYTANEEELEEHFSKFGDVSQVHIVIDKDTKRSKGIAYVRYAVAESAMRALEELDNSDFQGRLLHVLPAKEKSSSDQQGIDVSVAQTPKNFKQKREEERKASEASGDTRAWNSFFMRSDTVVENIARKYGVSKSELLDREADDLAVRIALAETQVIAETKKALTNAGVNVSSLEEYAAGKVDGVKRSNHVLLVKNLPYGSSENELAKMFSKFGSLDKIILPPTKTLALVVFLEPAEARAAFRGLLYKRYKDAPLYLEWAPGNILTQCSTSKIDEKNNALGEHDAKRFILEQQEGLMDMDIDPDRVESRTLFVKNLNFKTTDESLKKHFTDNIKEGRILSVKVKKHEKNGKNVSMGFGFIQFDSVETATNICRDLQGTVLDGHALILQFCHAKKDEQMLKKVDKDKSSSKLLVRNVAFEATEKDLRQLFSPFGQIKSLRLPKKFGNHRGFAFVEYVTKQEAQNALQALSSTHLYGRHLVLERAKEGESLEELRARTAAQFTEDQNGLQNPTKLSKKRKNMAILDEGTMKFKRIAN